MIRLGGDNTPSDRFGDARLGQFGGGGGDAEFTAAGDDAFQELGVADHGRIDSVLGSEELRGDGLNNFNFVHNSAPSWIGKQTINTTAWRIKGGKCANPSQRVGF